MSRNQTSSEPVRSDSSKPNPLRGQSIVLPLWKSPTWFWEVVLILLAFAATGWLGTFFEVEGLPIRCFRPVSGVCFLVLWYRGLDRWPMTVLGYLLVALGTQRQGEAIPAFILGEVGSQALGVWLVRRAVSGRNPGERLKDALRFVVYGSLVAPAIGAVASTTALWWITPRREGHFSELFVIRWLAQSLAVLLIAPLGFAWSNWKWQSRKWLSHWWEIVLFIVVMTSLAAWTFGRQIGALSLPIPDVVLVMPICFWAMIRWGMRGNSATTLAISVMSVLAALHDRGPFSREGGDLVFATLILSLGNSIVFGATTLLTSALMTERQEATDSLGKIEVRYQILFQNSPDAVFVLDMQTDELLEFNNRFPELLRCPRDELRGRHRHDFDLDFEPIDFSYESSVLSPMKTRTADHDSRFRCGDGEIIDVNVTYSVIDFFGRQAQLMIARDVTARRKAEQQLAESEEKFRVLAETIPSLVTIQRDQRPLYVNPALVVVSGYSLEELQQTSFFDLLRDRDRADAAQHLQRFSTESVPWQREVSLRTKSGAERRVDLTVTPIRLEDRNAWLASAVDVTERRQAEAELRQLNAELFHSARLRLLGEFVAGIAHDLKHPIGAIELLATGMLNRLEAGEGLSLEFLHAEFQMVLSQTERGVERITRLENLSRRHETERRWIDLAPLVVDASRLVRLNQQWSDVPIVLKTDPTRPRAFADRAEMTQVLLDMLRNAMEAMQETPQEKRQIRVTIVSDRPGSLRLTITDSGCGIPPDFRPKMFKAFHSTKSEGLGLGLSLCHTVVVERHQGELKYEPASPQGSTFHIFLPAEQTS